MAVVSGSSGLRKPEVLAPAGEWDCVKAAVENGADAVFFGVGRFNARVRAKNFEEADLPELMAYLHGRGVKGYVTFNTLIFPEELAEAARTLRAIIAAGVDAAIVQDAGICRLIRLAFVARVDCVGVISRNNNTWLTCRRRWLPRSPTTPWQ